MIMRRMGAVDAAAGRRRAAAACPSSAAETRPRALPAALAPRPSCQAQPSGRPTGGARRSRRTWAVTDYLFTLTGPGACPYSRIFLFPSDQRQARSGRRRSLVSGRMCVGMINYTERIALLMQDVVSRTPALVVHRPARGAGVRPLRAPRRRRRVRDLSLPDASRNRARLLLLEDRATGELTRRSEWFVTKTPEVRVGATRIKYLISFVLPRFCEQTLERSWKAELYDGAEPWVAKLDTIVHELYHIDPAAGRHAPVRATPTARAPRARTRRSSTTRSRR